MTQPLDDLAERVANTLRQQHIAALEADPREMEKMLCGQVIQKENEKSIFAKIYFSWRPEDKMILEQIKMAARKMFEEQFSEAIFHLDRFYNLTKDEHGNDHWDRLSGSDIEAMLFTLSNLRFALSPQVNELLRDAIYARQVSEDTYHDHWNDAYDGTQGDKIAKASRASRQDKYHAFFRFTLYSTADAFMKELNNFERVLTRAMDWRARGYR